MADGVLRETGAPTQTCKANLAPVYDWLCRKSVDRLLQARQRGVQILDRFAELLHATANRLVVPRPCPRQHGKSLRYEWLNGPLVTDAAAQESKRLVGSDCKWKPDVLCAIRTHKVSVSTVAVLVRPNAFFDTAHCERVKLRVQVGKDGQSAGPHIDSCDFSGFDLMLDDARHRFEVGVDRAALIILVVSLARMQLANHAIGEVHPVDR